MNRPASHHERVASVAAWFLVAGSVGALVTGEVYDGSKPKTAAQFALAEVPVGYQREDEGQPEIPGVTELGSPDLSGKRSAIEQVAVSRLGGHPRKGSRY